MRNVRAKKNQVALIKKFNAIANDPLPFSFEYINQFALRMDMKRRTEIGNISFNNNQLLLR
jgi:hypothetical protein